MQWPVFFLARMGVGCLVSGVVWQLRWAMTSQLLSAQALQTNNEAFLNWAEY